jgi:hypothetical protein
MIKPDWWFREQAHKGMIEPFERSGTTKVETSASNAPQKRCTRLTRFFYPHTLLQQGFEALLETTYLMQPTYT